MQKFENMFHKLEEHGWFMADGLMPSGLTDRLYDSAWKAWKQGLFRDAQA